MIVQFRAISICVRREAERLNIAPTAPSLVSSHASPLVLVSNQLLSRKIILRGFFFPRYGSGADQREGTNCITMKKKLYPSGAAKVRGK